MKAFYESQPIDRPYDDRIDNMAIRCINLKHNEEFQQINMSDDFLISFSKEDRVLSNKLHWLTDFST